MNKQNFIGSLGAALLLATSVSTFGQSAWETVDDFQSIPGKGAAVAGLAAAGNGIVFSACMMGDPAGQQHGIIRRSLDGGQSWLNVFDVPGTTFANCWSVTVGPSGAVFATASARPPGSPNSKNWLTIRSIDGGDTWDIVDSFIASGLYNSPFAVVQDGVGRVFAGGMMWDAQGKHHWLIRRSLDGGTTWATVDDIPGANPAVMGMTVSPAGVFAAGRLSNAWIVRRSTNGGATWTTVDDYRVPTYGSYANGITSDASGNLYVTGAANLTVKRITKTHWITRRSTNGGATWQTVDDVISGSSNVGKSITADVYGRIFTSGQINSGNTSRWITRASINGGATWVTTDDYAGSTGINTFPRGAASDAVGNVFVGGQANGSDGVAHAVVRKLATP